VNNIIHQESEIADAIQRDKWHKPLAVRGERGGFATKQPKRNIVAPYVAEFWGLMVPPSLLEYNRRSIQKIYIVRYIFHAHLALGLTHQSRKSPASHLPAGPSLGTPQGAGAPLNFYAIAATLQ
jgi:hypothetical protein